MRKGSNSFGEMGSTLVLLVLFFICSSVAGQTDCVSLISAGENGQAFTCFGKAIEEDPSVALDWAGQGDALNNMGYYHQALLYYKTALELDPNDARIWTSKGRTETRLGEYGDAATSLAKAANLDPNDAYVWTSIGDLLSQTGKDSDAQTAYSKASALKEASHYSSEDTRSSNADHGSTSNGPVRIK